MAASLGTRLVAAGLGTRLVAAGLGTRLVAASLGMRLGGCHIARVAIAVSLLPSIKCVCVPHTNLANGWSFLAREQSSCCILSVSLWMEDWNSGNGNGTPSHTSESCS